MPITKTHFELGINPEIEAVMRKLASFLAEHRDEAYSFEELWHEEFGPTPLRIEVRRYVRAPDSSMVEAIPVEHRRFAYALMKLVAHGVVQERIVGGVPYFAIGSVRLTEVLKS